MLGIKADASKVDPITTLMKKGRESEKRANIFDVQRMVAKNTKNVRGNPPYNIEVETLFLKQFIIL